jgi:hypothetical protein
METENKITRLVFALATPSLEELPQGNPIDPARADELIDFHLAWTALWSPRVLGPLGFLPECRRADPHGLDIENALIVVPQLAASTVDQPLQERLNLSSNRLLFSRSKSRLDLIEEICRILEPGMESDRQDLPAEADELECDFCSFGYAVMQVQQMARKLRYSFNLDWMVVSDQMIQASRCFNQGDYEQAEHWLSAAFDSLSQERDRYCSQQGYLIHLVLTAPSTLAGRLSKEMQNSVPTSLFATQDTLQRLRASNPEGFEALCGRMADKSISIAGGFACERKHTYLSELSLHRSLLKARSQAQATGIAYPKVLLPFHPSIPAHLPGAAKLHGFEGVVLARFLDGLIPEKEHAKLKWSSTSDGPAIDAVLGHVVDANDPRSVLELGSSMSKQLDYHQVPTLLVAHWPDRTCSVFGDLCRIMSRTPALGKWILLDDYFRSTSQPYWTDQFGPSHFPFAIPDQSEQIHATQISLVHLQRNLHAFERLSDALICWKHAAADSKNSQDEKSLDSVAADRLIEQIQAALDLLDSVADHGADKILSPEAWVPIVESQYQSLREQASIYIAQCLGASADWTVLQPASHPRRIGLRLPVSKSALDLDNSDRIVAVDTSEVPDSTHIVVDVPPFGFCRIAVASELGNRPSTKPQSAKRQTTSLLSKMLGQRSSIAQSDGSLANEYMEVQVDPKKGHLRSIHIRDQRGNRLSGMVSLAPKPAGSHHRISPSDWIGLSQITVEQTGASSSQGMCITRGSFDLPTQDANKAPWIEQTIRLQKGCKWVEVCVSGGGFDRKSHTPVWRMVWPSEAATLQMWTHGSRTKWLGPLQANVELIEIDDAEHQVYYATGGLSYHTRQGANELQSLLPIQTDGSLSVSFFLGIDWQRPWETAIDLFETPWLIPPSRAEELQSQVSKDRATSGWLAQCNHPNLRISFVPGSFLGGQIGPYIQSERIIQPDLLVWMSEGSGKSSRAKISLPKTASEAWKVDFSGQILDKIGIEGSDLVVPYGAWEKSLLAVILER